MPQESHIRFAQTSDINAIIDLCEAHAIYEQCVYDKTNKAALLGEHLFQANAPLKCLVAEVNEEVIGYATFMKQFSTWDAHYYIYMDCLFLKEQARGHGIGELLVNAIKQYAAQEACTEIQWQTPKFNTRAIKFYHRIGANSKAKERFFLAVETSD